MIFSIHWKAQIWKQVSFLLKVPNFLGVLARLCFPIPVHPLVWDWNSKIEDYPPPHRQVCHITLGSDIRNSPHPTLLLLPPVKVSDYITRECHSRLTFTIIVTLPSSLQFLKSRTKKHHFNQLKKIWSPIVFLMTSYFLALGIFSVFLESILGSSVPALILPYWS